MPKVVIGQGERQIEVNLSGETLSQLPGLLQVSIADHLRDSKTRQILPENREINTELQNLIKAIQETTQPAELRTIIDDQGGGMSYCSSCNTKIDLGEMETMPKRCPNPECDKPLIYVPWTRPAGGSDFG
ncbi:MAG: hypothetical protein ABSC49_01695 [Candidatus Microgenomates bacterium]|jgi:hypothetical protein